MKYDSHSIGILWVDFSPKVVIVVAVGGTQSRKQLVFESASSNAFDFLSLPVCSLLKVWLECGSTNTCAFFVLHLFLSLCLRAWKPSPAGADCSITSPECST